MLTFFTILFNPDNNAIENIKNAVECGARVVVYLNKVSSHYEHSLRIMGVNLIGKNINEGLGVAFNDFEIYMNSNNLEYYIYFDQDTFVTADSWTEILGSYRAYFEDCRIGLVNVLPTNKKYPKLVVSSGSIFSMRVLNSIGLHDKTYFVEGVDYEYCFRLITKNYQIVSSPVSGVNHQKLQDGEVIKIFGLNFLIRVYGNARVRDFNRSHFRLLRKSVELKRFDYFIFFIKSIVVFNLKEFASRVIFGIKK